MAKIYIKLGPIGDAFASNELGIFLNPGDAAQIDDVLMTTRLKAFFKTGFLVEISKIEYDNIIIRSLNARNIPLISVSVTEVPILEPVENVLRIPPTDVKPNRRYLVFPNAEGPWLGKDDYIASFDGANWNFRKPENGMILPVYAWGISLKYVGTYPSGKWDYNPELIPEIQELTEEELSNEAYAYELFAKEREERIAADLVLEDLIKKIQNPAQGSITASQVSIVDEQNYFEGTNVEIALIELALALREQGKAIGKINELITQLQQIINTLKDQNSPTYLYEGNIDTPTTVKVGGIEAGSFIEAIELTDLFERIFNPNASAEFDVEMLDKKAGEIVYIAKGDSVSKLVDWSLTTRSNPIISASISNVSGISPSIPANFVGSLSGTAQFTPNNVDGVIEFQINSIDGPQSKSLNVKYNSHVLWGYDDEANLGKVGIDLWNQLVNRTPMTSEQIKSLLVNFTNKHLIIAIPTRYNIVNKILDIANLNNINAFNKRTASLTTAGLGNNYSESYEVYEAKYIGSSNGTWEVRSINSL